jgi:tRNA dimethylallyltransferase
MAELGERGLEPLVEELKRVDPVTWEQIDRNNPARVVRALEVWRGSGQPISEFRGRKADRVNPWTDIRIGLNPMAMGEEREDMYRRIEARVDAMMASGWLEETRKVGQKYGLDCKGLQSLGYRELVAHLQGKADLESTVELIKRNTRRYAKRQMTWFRRYPEIRWFSPEETGNIRGYLKSRLP